jgi:hypothetical protein
LRIIIPSYHEENLFETIHSLETCAPAHHTVFVYIVLNHCESEDKEIKNLHLLQMAKLGHLNSKESHISIRPLLFEMDDKKGGVGLARKFGMDRAAMDAVSEGNPQELLVCLDADCRVAKNYLQVLQQAELEQTNIKALSIRYEHEFVGLNDKHKEGIIGYEGFLRYYVLSLRWAQYPFSHQTVGSAMAVRADTYLKSGGMNTKKAGEDFYFLHKLMPLGGFVTISNTTVFPSPRLSNRVPFGTGKAMQRWLENDLKSYLVPHFEAFVQIKKFCETVNSVNRTTEANTFLDKLPFSIVEFIGSEKIVSAFNQAKQNSSNDINLQKRLFKWFDGFKVMKFLHYYRDNIEPDVALEDAVTGLFQTKGLSLTFQSMEDLLLILRELELDSNDYKHPLF